MTKDKETVRDSGIVIPGKDPIALSQATQLENLARVDFTIKETFPTTDELDGMHMTTVVFAIHLFLAQMSRVWRDRRDRDNNRTKDLERRVELLERRCRRLEKERKV